MADVDGLGSLSPREHELFVLFLEGHPMKEIAGRMGIDPRTASSLKARLMRKLRITTDVSLVLYGLRVGLLDDEPGCVPALDYLSH